MSKTVNAKRVEFTMNNEMYRMDKYKSRTILLFKKIDGVYDFIEARPVLRQKLQEIDPVKYSMNNTQKVNTRDLGAKLYGLIK